MIRYVRPRFVSTPGNSAVGTPRKKRPVAYWERQSNRAGSFALTLALDVMCLAVHTATTATMTNR